MLTLNPSTLAKTSLPLGTTWLLGDCMESKGKQDLWAHKKPQVLQALRERAIVQSVESSNRIEGVTVAPARLRPVVLGKAKPRDRSEEELAGYRRALDWIFSRKGVVRISPDIIRRLHAMAQGGRGLGGPGDAGEWKKRNNEIMEIGARGDRRVRFVPASAKDTPRLVRELCERYETARERRSAPALLLVATFVFDFLCIHPFRDGNGRVSRLLTALLLQSEGFQLARYVSLERLVETSKDDYYRVLEDCSRGWHAGKCDVQPWWNYVLGVVRSGYREFEDQVVVAGAPAKSDLVRRLALDQAGDFTLADLAALTPEASRPLVKKVLYQLRGEGHLRLRGRGRGARWRAA